MNLLARDGWIFDLDGTLTVAAHDFDAIRVELDLPPGEPILEALDALPAVDAAPRRVRLLEIERELAHEAKPALGAAPLLAMLSECHAQLGILTRNDRELARITLAACGLAEHFEPAHILGREEAQPKPSPDGVQRLQRAWGLSPERSVMVGDFLFDLQAGRRAGAAAVWVDSTGEGTHADQADLTVRSLEALRQLLVGAV